jgi:uncharacterized protein (DUF885 family)
MKKVCLLGSGILIFLISACGQVPAAETAPVATTEVTIAPTPQLTITPSITEIIANLQGLTLDEFMDVSYTQLRLRDPDGLIHFQDCFSEQPDTLTNLSDPYRADTFALESAILAQLRSYHPNNIPPNLKLSYEVYEWYLDDLVRGQAFADLDFPINGYGLWDQANYMIDSLLTQTITSSEDALSFLSRLSQTGTWVDQLLQQLATREQAGVIPPVFLLKSAVAQLNEYLQTESGGFDVESSELYTSFATRLKEAGIDAQEQASLLEAAGSEIEQIFLPAFERLRAYLVGLEVRAPQEGGLSSLPNGAAYYAWLLRRYTGTDLTAAEIHQAGLDWVANLQAEMRRTAVELGYSPDISMADLDSSITEHESALEGEALMAEYERLLTAARTAAADAFDIFPSAEVVITYDPDSPVPGMYTPPPFDGSGPGQMVVNLQNPDIGPLLYNENSLVNHEAIPGHHVQIALALDLDLPLFRNPFCTDVYYRDYEFEGSSEGWAVYAEHLGIDMGLYGDDHWKILDTLRLLLNQAVRMVIDTGIHSLGWTRAQAAAYYTEATGRPATPEQMNRYVALPGQAVSYGFGAYTILKLRQEAMEQLGAHFDLAEFHDQILGAGPVPTGFLEKIVMDWIFSQ